MKTFQMWIVFGLIFSIMVYMTIYVCLSKWYLGIIALILGDCIIINIIIDTAKYLWTKKRQTNRHKRNG